MSMTSTKATIPSRHTPSVQNYNGIDLCKFLCSILVFCIHVPPFSADASRFEQYLNFGMQHYLGRIAVPFFFVSSGFLLFRNMPLCALDHERIKGYCFKLLRLYATWKFLLVLGADGHLWYLPASVVAVILVSLCFHCRFKFHTIWLLAGILYVIGLLGDSYYGIVEPLSSYPLIDLIFRVYRYLFTNTRNGLFMGFIFVLMGASFAHSGRVPSLRISLIGFICSMGMLSAEVFVLMTLHIPAEYNMYVFLIPAVYFLFSFAFQLRLKDRPIFKRLRTAGLWFYFSHLFFNFCVSKALEAAEMYLNLHLNDYIFLFSLTATLLFAFAAEALSRKTTFKWLNYLIS